MLSSSRLTPNPFSTKEFQRRFAASVHRIRESYATGVAFNLAEPVPVEVLQSIRPDHGSLIVRIDGNAKVYDLDTLVGMHDYVEKRGAHLAQAERAPLEAKLWERRSYLHDVAGRKLHSLPFDLDEKEELYIAGLLWFAANPSLLYALASKTFVHSGTKLPSNFRYEAVEDLCAEHMPRKVASEMFHQFHEPSSGWWDLEDIEAIKDSDTMALALRMYAVDYAKSLTDGGVLYSTKKAAKRAARLIRHFGMDGYKASNTASTRIEGLQSYGYLLWTTEFWNKYSEIKRVDKELKRKAALAEKAEANEEVQREAQADADACAAARGWMLRDQMRRDQMRRHQLTIDVVASKFGGM